MDAIIPLLREFGFEGPWHMAFALFVTFLIWAFWVLFREYYLQVWIPRIRKRELLK